MERIIQTITFNNAKITLVEDSTHEFLMTNKDVTYGYGVDAKTVNRDKTEHSDELIEGKHFIKAFYSLKTSAK